MKNKELRIVKRLFYYMTLLVALLLTACSSDETIDNEQPLPEGMGRIRIAICTPENNPNLTRAVNVEPWEMPDHEWEKLQTFRIFICDANNKVVQIISGDKSQMGNTSTSTEEHPYQSAEVTSDPLSAGDYLIYATANYDDGYSVGSTIDLEETIKLANGYSEVNIPMTGKLSGTVTVTAGSETNAGTITVWRVKSKLQFEFTNESAEQIQILGVEVDPINQASASGSGIYLFSKDDLTSIANLAAPTLSEAANDVTITWSLHDDALQTGATVSAASLISQADLSWGAKLASTGKITASDANNTTLQKFKATKKVIRQDDGSAVVFAVKPASGYAFTPKKLSFKACRGGTGGGHFDVVTVSNGIATTLATGQRPMRYNGNGDTNPEYVSSYGDYTLTSAATTGTFYVKIYLYDLDVDKEYAFSDVVITGDVKSVGSTKTGGVTLPSSSLTDVGTIAYEPSSPLVLNATNGTGTLFFYVNETDATFTNSENQLSLRFKIKRGNGEVEELRYGMTTPYIDGRTGGDGFNVIRRNDWIHIPIRLTDWQFRIEPLAFAPIAGYPATTLSSDALRATFSTGGPIILQPFAQKNNDGSWRDFSNPEVTFVSLSWKNNDGTNVSGDGKIITTPFTYDSANHCIIGELNNSFTTGTYKTTVTVNVKLGPSGSQYDYSFTCDVVLQK